jgi:hypothetical protein
MRVKFSFSKGVVGLALLLSLQLCVHARVYRVSVTSDGIGSNTLRDAVSAANRRGRTSTIVLSRGDYQLTGQTLNDELPITTGRLTIMGSKQTSVTISAVKLEHIFHVYPGAKLTLMNLTLTGGGQYIYNDSVCGGACLNEGSLTLINCSISGNRAAKGAGIYNVGSLDMTHVTIYGNVCFNAFGGSGGGIYNTGSLKANNCLFLSNRCGNGIGGNSSIGSNFIDDPIVPILSIAGGSGGDGGAIYNAGSCSLSRCKFQVNYAGSGGYAHVGTLQGADGGDGGNGGGIYNKGRLNLSRCYFNNNYAGPSGPGAPGGSSPDDTIHYAGGYSGIPGSGGGVFNASGATTKIYNSLFFLNYRGEPNYETVSLRDRNLPFDFFTSSNTRMTYGLGPDVCGNFISLGYNLIGEADDSTGFVNQLKHDIVGSMAAPADQSLFRPK